MTMEEMNQLEEKMRATEKSIGEIGERFKTRMAALNKEILNKRSPIKPLDEIGISSAMCVMEFNEAWDPTPRDLKESIRSLGISMKALANYIGIAPAYLCGILNGQHRLTKSIRDEIVDLLAKAAHGMSLIEGEDYADVV